jgi:hypothetical protein
LLDPLEGSMVGGFQARRRFPTSRRDAAFCRLKDIDGRSLREG